MPGSIIQRSTCLALLTAALSVFLTAGAGCGASHNGCIALAQAQCAKRSQCSSYLSTIIASDVDYCQRFLTNDCSASTAAPDVAYGDASAAACAQAYATLSCDDYFTNNLPSACHPAGNRANGAACGDDFQCQSNYCQGEANKCGACAPVAKMGEACTGRCAPGLQCAQGTCQAFRKAGESCDSTISCLPSLACVQSLCAPPMLGQACSAQDECSALEAHYCSASTLSCTLFPFAISKVGEPCGFGSTKVFFCGGGLFCKAPDGADFGVCNTLPQVGSPCGGDDGLTCAAPGLCVNGTCQNFDRNACK